MYYVAECTKCGEQFDTLRRDPVHYSTDDGHPCGGHGTIIREIES
jgi:hypothetical protein